MWERVGIVRERDALRAALAEFEQISRANLSTSSNKFVTLARLVATAALWREESRGGHYRADFPEQCEEFHVHSVQRRGHDISKSVRIDFS
jgi:L-aspartate oxidase